MKKMLLISLSLFILFFLVGCSQEEAGKNNPLDNPVTNPVGHTQDMINLKNNMQKNIQDATDQENQHREQALNSLNDNNMQNTQTGQADNSVLVAKYPFARIKTSLGEIKIKMEGKNAPVTTGNFLKLASDGFYANTKFHRVIKGFMIQGGDPLSKDASQKSAWGTGGPGYKFKDELSGKETYTQGTVAMANAGPNTNGSQFFIVTADPGYSLSPNYTVFGQVVSGMDTALKIENVKTETSDRPVEDVTIESVALLEK